MTAGQQGIPHTILQTDLQALYNPHTHFAVGDQLTNRLPHTHVTQVPTVLAAGDNNDDAWADEMAKELADMVARVHRTGGRHAQDKPVTAAFAKKLWDGVEKGYGKPLLSIDYDSPDTKMLGHLMENVYTFSAAKNQQQLRALTNALIDPETKKLRSFSEFKKAAFQINNEHVNRWLKAEYNLAVAGGQMASKWVDFEKNAKTLPMLEFDAVIDKKTTDTCRGLHGVIKPFNDPFWNVYYPPNHFGCRSTVRQRGASYKPTADDKFTKPDIPPMFRTNLAKEGLIFPKGHSYYNNAAVLSFGDANFVKEQFRQGKGNVYESGRVVNQNKTNDPRHIVEVERKRVVGNALANHFDTDVFLLPEFDNPSKDLRYPYFFTKAKPGKFKQPDFFFQEKYWEMEGYDKYFDAGKIGNMISNGVEQAENVIIHLRHRTNIARAIARAKNSIAKRKWKDEIKEVIIVAFEGTIHKVL